MHASKAERILTENTLASFGTQLKERVAAGAGTGKGAMVNVVLANAASGGLVLPQGWG
jgi:hypothetical protein